MAFPNWTHKRKLKLDTTSQGAGVSGDVEYFPALVRLDSSNFDFSEAKDQGEDMRFADSDDYTELWYEIERWDKNGEKAEIWVLIPKVDGDSDTDCIYMYWGNANAQDAQHPEEVFDPANHFVAVWHMGDDLDDVTGNGHDGTNQGTTVDAATAMIAKSRQFDGSDDYIDAGTFDVVASGSGNDGITLSGWFKADDFSTADFRIISKAD